MDWRRPSNVLSCYRQAVAALGLESDPCLPCFTYVLRRRVVVEGGNGNASLAASLSSSFASSVSPLKVRGWEK